MAGTFIINASTVNVNNKSATLMKVGFGDPGQNDELVRSAKARLEELRLEGGELCLINGPASLPVALVIGHGTAHLFKSVAVFDPKMGGYVVAVSHDENRAPGSFIPSSEVTE